MSLNSEQIKNTDISQYILITPARNEEEFIKLTIDSVIKQTLIPLKWVIISDGSTDRTDEIVKEYVKSYPFIKLISRNPSAERNFASKVNAIKEGYESIKDLKFDYIGFSDADMSCESNFFESIIDRMNRNPKQGIGGGVVYEKETELWSPVVASYDWSVSGTMQMFRRQCYEEIDGYKPLKRGGIDTIAEVMARINGWEVKTFVDIKLFHHRIMGAKRGNKVKSNFKRGILEYSIGYHPLIQILRFFSRIPSPPFFIASFMRTLGYYFALFRREPFSVPDNIIEYFRKEQLNRVITSFLKKF
ncbi:MAG: glycosyltransferase family A protein [Melioribacteraceae bacterium]